MEFLKSCYELCRARQDDVEKVPNVTTVWDRHCRCCWLIGFARFHLNYAGCDQTVLSMSYDRCQAIYDLVDKVANIIGVVGRR